MSSPYGWYEHLVTPRLESMFEGLAENPPTRYQSEPDLEALKEQLVRHLRPLLGAALEVHSPEEALEVVSQLILLLSERHPEMLQEIPKGELLQAVLAPRTASENQARALASESLPKMGFTSSELFTGRERDLSLFEELRREIRTATSIDLVISFLRWSGLRLVHRELVEARDRGAQIRVVTTVYLGATEVRAVEELDRLGAEVRLSYNGERGRLHAKAWIFHRPRDLGTSYVGSSNLSRDALTDGLEWNVKATQRESPTLFRRTADSFEALTQDTDFERYTPQDKEKLQQALASAGTKGGTIRLRDLPLELREKVRSHLARTTPAGERTRLLTSFRADGFQQEVLDQLEGERSLHGRYRNLVVLPTGTGKTVVAALDYARQIQQGIRPRLLFVAHREELLQQARRTFRAVLQDAEFGEIWKAEREPNQWNHVFGSIQTLNNRQDEFARRWPQGDWFEYLVIDEAHRGKADSYRFLLTKLHPRILLGLTATPERTDGGQIVQDYGDRFAAEVRLGEGIARERLVPFHYFGIAEGVPDLSRVGWNQGRYVQEDLDRQLAGDSFARAVFEALYRVVGQPQQMRALGFCTGLKQAAFLARWFTDHGLQAAWVSGDHDSGARHQLIGALADGDLQILFTVDLLNEGVDIPAVDTVLFLRPTESLTVFLQQLGRGLRLCPGKNLLTVLDFVGRAHQNYDFTHKFRGLLGVGKTDVRRQIESNYPSLPPGCAIVLERQAEEEILKHIAAQIPSNYKKLLEQVAEFRDQSFPAFLQATGWDPEFVLRRGGLWYQMVRDLGSQTPSHPKREEALADFVLTSVLCCDSPDLVQLWRDGLRQSSPDHPGADLLTQLLAKNGQIETWGNRKDCWNWVIGDSMRREELDAWFRWQNDRLENRGFEVPGLHHLRQFCSYDFKTIAWAQGRSSWGKTDVFQGGVHRVGKATTTCWNLYVTIRKSEQDYSRDTLYRDWAINQEVFHWESPNDWIPGTLSGHRFLAEIQAGIPVYLFVRELKTDRWGRTPPYLFLGEVKLEAGSVGGERPIAMKFRLKERLPMVHFRRFCQDAVS